MMHTKEGLKKVGFTEKSKDVMGVCKKFEAVTKSDTTLKEDLGVCVRCKKNKATLVFTESVLNYIHGFKENICQECYDKMSEETPLYKKAFKEGKEKTKDEIIKMIEDVFEKREPRLIEGTNDGFVLDDEEEFKDEILTKIKELKNGD